MLGMNRENRHFLSEILWTNEATFRSDGNVNLHNVHYWFNNNPNWLHDVQHQSHWNLNIWCGILLVGCNNSCALGCLFLHISRLSSPQVDNTRKCLANPVPRTHLFELLSMGSVERYWLANSTNKERRHENMNRRSHS